MRRFLTLVCLLCVAIPAGISISGCTRNPAANYCNGLGYGSKITDVASIFLQPQTTGISIAFGQTTQVGAPTAQTCKGTTAAVSSVHLRHHQQPDSRHLAFWQHLRWNVEPEYRRRNSPTTPIATRPIHCPRPTGCLTPPRMLRLRRTRSPPTR